MATGCIKNNKYLAEESPVVGNAIISYPASTYVALNRNNLNLPERSDDNYLFTYCGHYVDNNYLLLRAFTQNNATTVLTIRNCSSSAKNGKDTYLWYNVIPMSFVDNQTGGTSF